VSVHVSAILKKCKNAAWRFLCRAAVLPSYVGGAAARPPSTAPTHPCGLARLPWPPQGVRLRLRSAPPPSSPYGFPRCVLPPPWGVPASARFGRPLKITRPVAASRSSSGTLALNAFGKQGECTRRTSTKGCKLEFAKRHFFYDEVLKIEKIFFVKIGELRRKFRRCSPKFSIIFADKSVHLRHISRVGASHTHPKPINFNAYDTSKDGGFYPQS